MRISIRDLLWLTLVIAIAAVWQIERLNFTSKLSGQADELARMTKELESWPELELKRLPPWVKLVPINQP